MKIVYVDDDPNICSEVEDFFFFVDCQAWVFNKPRECWDFLVETDGEIDVLIVDLMMPEMDGTDLILKCIEAFGNKIKFGVVSGRIDISGKFSEVANVVDLVVEKPLRSTDLHILLEAGPT